MSQHPTRSGPAPARAVEVEVLPREARSPGADQLSALIARIMDALFTIPGTRIKVGLDPLISLFPVVGSPASAAVSLLLLFRAAQSGVPNVVLFRMAGNIILNTLLGEVPILGDAISIFFRSNARNHELLKKHAGTRRPATLRDKLVLAGLIGGLVLILLCLFIGFFWLMNQLWMLAFHSAR